MQKERKLRAIRLLPICIFLLMILACNPEPKVAGTYVSDANDSPRRSETTLELKDNGAGTWKVGDDEVAFSWYLKGEELRVNTKGGGVLVGSLDKNLIRINLPGAKEMSFRRLK